jgi:hypothetical protein
LVSLEEIEAAKTSNGGWTKEQLEQWGVPWPPPKGWKKQLTKGARSMADYDNTNSGAAFKPFDSQRMILQGKVNLEGNERKVVMVADQTRGGDNIIEVYQKVGVLFDNDKKGNESAPDYSGPVEDYATNKDMRIAAWKRQKDGANYMSMQVTEKQKGGSNNQLDDKIPF